MEPAWRLQSLHNQYTSVHLELVAILMVDRVMATKDICIPAMEPVAMSP